MDIYLHNTLTGEKEKFTPITDGHVSMYNCGPTVYNYAHIGNLRSYVFADTLRRMFEWNNFTVKQVINITDVGHLVSDNDDGEDKIEKGAQREGKTAQEISEFYTQAFFTDLDQLNIAKENISFPRATNYIDEQIAMISELERDGYTYNTHDGVYFDTTKYPQYGLLGHINLAGLEEGARIGVNNEKKHLTDFALWKFSRGEKREQEWNSPWGVGFPGWHIECSAMSRKLLGKTFDIHTGGIDHIPVHHNNEIAQSVCANHAPFVHYWMHNAWLTVGEDKMSKSSDNFIRLETLAEHGINPLAYRYLLLTARYSSPLQFSWEALEGAQTAWKRLRTFVNSTTTESTPTKNTHYINEFTAYINDDLDTPKAIALVWEIMKDSSLEEYEKKEILLQFDRVFGLQLDHMETFDIPENIHKLVTERDTARKEKDFAKSDTLRIEIEQAGFEVTDTPEGTKITKK
ncbi:MAG: cysteinyl-tRNA synthetase [Patescibacteria group bacterium]|nr:cysteinyl-tRNA synthetase [Patescibacteria group bacterium]